MAYDPSNPVLDELKQLNQRMDMVVQLLQQQRPGANTDHVTTKEAATLLKCSCGTVRRWLREGKLTSVKLNDGVTQDRHLIPRLSVAKLLNNQTHYTKGKRI